MNSDDRQIIKHESFGFIRANRVSGSADLFDSALNHQHYITVTIGRAYAERSYSETVVYAEALPLIEIDMSEAQFAQFITSINSSSGAPCTLSRVDGKRVPPPPPDTNTRETFEKEVAAAAAQSVTELQEAVRAAFGLIAKGKANKTELSELLHLIQNGLAKINSTMPFLMSQFAEGIEKLTERAKADINAHAVMQGQRLMMREADEQKRIV